ncbi:unnamed protein product [Arctia plantaginis]|uniref:Integrin alpha second immunoglobulin-like domain-containing protein n=1 Tax=Arctia plantaginis TaxID=874455 RepID=A0A8S0ZSH9_ARCPL|nr:unnamed protein product [Arctia plantaginis]
MSNIFLVTFMSLFMVSKIILAKFLHDPSAITICPLKHENDSDFGYAMGYQSFSNKLVVGAPSENVHGRVYICNMKGANVSSEIKCKEESINIPIPARVAKTVAFRLGASVSATSKHYLTCAPLWTGRLTPRFIPDVVGTCFFDGNNKPYLGIFEQTVNNVLMGRVTHIDTRIFVGGSGWTTLTDETNDLLVVVKSSLRGHIAYSPISQGDLKMNTIVSQNTTLEMWTSKHFNLGYGITAGKFFSKKTVYAFSLDMKDMRGAIAFLDYVPPHLYLMASDLDTYAIQSKAIATKFGSVLAAADMNNDTWDDLLIGEPLYTEEDCVDCGALHVYLGGDLDTIGKKNYLQILGIDSFGRLGSAVAVNDLDGDGIAEISVSAPYADKGLGVVYIISGYEVNQKLQLKEKLRLPLSELKHTQRVQKEDFRRLGFSLQFVSDTDDNGCSELVAGAPGRGEAVLLKCVQAIDISLSSKVKGGKDVREQDLNFTVEVCATVTYPKKPNDVDAHIKLTSDIIGEGILITNPEIEVNVSCRNCSSNDRHPFCKDVLVQLNHKEQGDYLFKSKAELLTDHIFNSTVFNSSWVVATPRSTLQTETKISRHCQGDDCKPNLFMKLFWSRSKEDTYTISSSSTETVIIEVFNNGSSSYDACVWVELNGAQMSRLLDNECREDKGGYRCDLPVPLRRDSKTNIKLLLKMDSSNVFKQLDVKAYLFEKCSSGVSNKDPEVLAIPYILLTNDVSVSGTNHERQFHELQKQDDKSKIMDVQEFLIYNNGKVTWKNIYATISTEKTVNIEKFKATLGTFICKEFDSATEFVRKCSLDIMPNTTLKVIATTNILRKDLDTHLKDKKLRVEYTIQLHLIPTKDIKQTSIFSVLKFGTELAVGQNKLLIGIIAGVVSLLMLIAIFIVLYKYGFFKREEKKKLLVHRESIRQRSTRRNTHISSAADEQGVEGITNLEANSDGDDVFDKDTKTKTTNDDGKLKTTAQVHS